MDKTQSNTKFIPRDYDIFAGLDVDKKSMAITFLDHYNEMKQIKIPYNAQQLINYVRNKYPDKRVAFAYEAGPTGFGLYDALTTQQYYCLVAAASRIPVEPGNRVKTNRLDSKKISETLRSGQLKPIHVPDGPYRELRQLTKLRDTFVQQLKATKTRIKALLLVNSIPFPGDENKWSWETIEQLKDLSTAKQSSETFRFHLDRFIVSLEFFRGNVLQTTRTIRAFCKQNEEISKNIKLLTSIPGIGFITASQLIARIGNWRQLSRCDQIGSFLGLVPSEKSTGTDINRGHITRLGNTNLRNKLVQCAWAAIRRDYELKEFYDQVYTRNRNQYGKQKAITAVARKLTTRIYAVLTEQREYKINDLTDNPDNKNN
jgi:transposase